MKYAQQFVIEVPKNPGEAREAELENAYGQLQEIFDYLDRKKVTHIGPLNSAKGRYNPIGQNYFLSRDGILVITTHDSQARSVREKATTIFVCSNKKFLDDFLRNFPDLSSYADRRREIE